MTEIAGQIGFDRRSIPRHIRPQAASGSPWAHESSQGPLVHRTPNGSIAIKGEPRLGGDSNPKTVARLLLESYLARGPQALSELRGPFAVLIMRPDRRTLLIAIDRMGVERMAWGRSQGWVSVGSSVTGVARTLSETPALNNQALFNFMYSHMIPAPGTAFDNVNKLLPGTAIEFSEHREDTYRIWQPDFSRGNANNDLAGKTRPLLREAIERTAPSNRTGAFLSGGLDSSTVSGLLSEVQSETTKVFSVGFGVDEYDEMEFARTAANHFGCSHYIYEVTPADIVDIIPKIAATYDEPFGNSSAVPTYCCARLAKENGVDHLLAGDGGDELFGGNERYVRQRVFELYNHVPGWLKKIVCEPFASRVDPESGVFPFRKISSYIRQAQIPLPTRLESWNLIYREGASRVFSENFLEAVDADALFALMNEIWGSCSSDDLLDQMLWYDWKFTLADNDIRKVSRMCELAGVRVSYPMLDEDFVEHSMKVPSAEKIRGYELRSYFKNEVRGFVPDKIIEKQKHGFGLPFGVWLKTDKPLQELVYGSIDSLAQRNIFEPIFLQRVVNEHKEGHASYYGYAIWDLVLLEQWLQCHTS